MDFPSTIWTVLRSAKDDPQGTRDIIIRQYWEPVRRYAQLHGLSLDDAEDLAQNVFLQICRDGFLEKADRTKGRFRGLLVAVTENLLKMWWRGEYSRKRRGQALVDENLAEAPEVKPVDDRFNRLWAENIVRGALDRFRAASDQAALPYCRAIEAFFLENRSYTEIARELDTHEGAVKNYIFRGKAKLGELIRGAIAEYCGSREEFDEEVRDLQRFLGD